MSNKIGSDVIGRRTTLGTRRKKKKISAEDLQKQIRIIAAHLKQNPKMIDEETKKKLGELVVAVEDSNPSFSDNAKKLFYSIGTAADIAQLFTFLSGIPSLPVLVQTLRIAKGVLDNSSVSIPRLSYRKRKPKIPKSTAYT